jgi:hypothetical protein
MFHSFSITEIGISYTPVAFNASLEALESFIVAGFFVGLLSIGIFRNSLCAITDTSAPVSYNQVVVAPGNVLTEMKGLRDLLLSLFSRDVFSAIFHVHILIIISTFNDPKGFFFAWLLVQLSLGASEELWPSFLI